MKNKDAIKIVENIAKRLLSEEAERFDGQDARAAEVIVKQLANFPYTPQMTNDKFLIEKYQAIQDIRISVMRYVEEKSNYKFVGTKNSWRMVKK